MPTRESGAAPSQIATGSWSESAPDHGERTPDPALSTLSAIFRRGDLALATALSEEALRYVDGFGLDLAEIRTLRDLGDIAHDQGLHRLAVERYVASLERTGPRGDMRVVADALAGIASAAIAWDQIRSASLLYGAADALRQRVGTAIVLPIDVAAVDRDLSTLRQVAGVDAYETILAEGRALSFAGIMAVAASVAEPVSDLSAVRATETAPLTPRENAVLDLLLAGKTDREIAAVLNMRPRTASWHMQSILQKLGASNRREVIAQARALGLV